MLWSLFFLILNDIASLIVLSVIGHTKTLAHHTCEGQGSDKGRQSDYVRKGSC